MKTLSHKLGILGALSLVLLSSTLSWADQPKPAAPPTLSKPNQADEPPDPIEENLISQAIAAYKTGKLAASASLFEQAYALKARPITGSNWIKVLDSTHDLLAAEKVAQDVLSRPRPTSPNQASDHDAMKKILEELSARIPTVTVVVAGVPAGKKAELKLDGSTAPVEQPQRVNPGSHKVSAKAEGCILVERSLTVKEREVFRLEIALQPLVPVAAGERPSSLRTIGFITGAAGLVGIGVGSALGIVAIQKNNESNDGHCKGDGCDLIGKGLRDDSIAMGNGSTAAFAIGGVALAAGVTMVLIAPKAGNAPTAKVGVGPRGVLFSGAW